ncbi:polyubiquitin 12-like [Tripterygium wilfordii]|uniref:polyubiquitin 12-like n=1 Tax=Tripterygium wilfordii TaxID=458696 RepID=UPI0018F80830|nr:polyubiquitin 12-like [Tripterygium wilfordii]
MADTPTIALNIQGGQLTGKVTVAKEAPILHLKGQIELVMGVNPSRQTLSFNGQVLDDTQTVKFYNLISGATVILAMTPLAGDPKFLIMLSSGSWNYAVNVKETGLVEDLKAKIGKKWAVPATDVTLTRHGEEMEDGFPLSAYLVCEDCVVGFKVNNEMLTTPPPYIKND